MGFRLPNGADLSEEQLDIINLPTTKDWVIKGAPGTGKTVMAIYRAGQASHAAKGKKVLLLVYNNVLMRFLSTAVRGNYYENVTVQTYHQWLSDIYRECKLGPVPKDGYDPIWDEIYDDLSQFGKKYAHIIIDEAQDFPVELLKILKMLSEHMTCFIDPNQAIEVGKTHTNDALKSMCVESPFKLTKNFRNTKPIRDVSALYCKDGEPAISYTLGRKPVIMRCASGDFDDVNTKMAEVILRNKEKDIGIIVNAKSMNRTFEAMQLLLPGDMSVQMQKSMTSNKIDFDQTGVKIVSYGTMKGLEFDLVLLPLFDRIPMQDGDVVDANRAYVAVSRAVEELYIFYWSDAQRPGKIDTMSQLRSHRDMLEWR